MPEPSSRDSYRYVYVAVMSGQTKIGVTADLKKRLRGATLVQAWEHQSPTCIERMCCDAFTHKRARCIEYFDATPEEAVALVINTMKRYDNGERPISNALRKRLKKGKRIKAMMEAGMSFAEAVRIVRPII